MFKLFVIDCEELEFVYDVCILEIYKCYDVVRDDWICLDDMILEFGVMIMVLNFFYRWVEK